LLLISPAVDYIDDIGDIDDIDDIGDIDDTVIVPNRTRRIGSWARPCG
jgi:hypothetical protein